MEVCLDDASALPVRHAGGFTLVDDGLRKRVKKLGWASTTPGDTLELEIQLPSKNVTCLSAEVSVGYLLSTDPVQGRMRLSCLHCECSSLPGLLAVSRAFSNRTVAFSNRTEQVLRRLLGH